MWRFRARLQVSIHELIGGTSALTATTSRARASSGCRGHHHSIRRRCTTFTSFCCWRPVLHAWRSDPLCGFREGAALALLEEHRLKLLRNILVHYRTVAIPLDVCVKTLQRLAPCDLTNFLALQSPVLETNKVFPSLLSVLGCFHINKCIPESCHPLEVHRQIDKVVATDKPLAVQKIEQHVALVVVWKIPQHHSGFVVILHFKSLT
mmetsp:Transcript_24533/g.47687  ORF Transcript_24533/g.47687 Transcript_24533/m.47687 type:complete len:207 (-) Transcript_24533:1060-1680(-)